MEWNVYFRRSFSKTLILAMKFTTLLIVTACLQISAAGFSQGITLSEKNAKLETIFHKIFQQTGYEFFFNSSMLEKAKVVSIEVRDEKIEKVLAICFRNQALRYEVLDKTIVIREKVGLADPPVDIKGRITNENDEPVNGATVRVKGSGTATVTNFNGEFLLENTDGKAILIISGAEIETLEVSVNNKPVVNYVVRVKQNELDKVVVMAYGTTTKRFNTGNISKVSAKEIETQPVSNPLVALEGRVPGLFISQSSGTPGAQVRFELRGQNSLRFDGNDPLFLVDGVPFPSTTLSPFISGGTGANLSPFDNLNPAEIESIEILKDADATAIYGSRGANGVILITTKKGKAGKTEVNLNAYKGIGKITRKMDLLNTQQYLAMRHEAFNNDGVLPQAKDHDINGDWDTTRYTDWQKEAIGGWAQFTHADASFSGGNSLTQFLLSGSFHKETTVFPGDSREIKTSIHYNISHSSADQRFHILFTGGYMNNKNQLPTYNFTNFLNLPPDAPAIYNDDGGLNWQNETWTNPYAFLLQKHIARSTNLYGNLEMYYEILPGLKVKFNGGVNKLESSDYALTPKTFYAPSLRDLVENESNLGKNSVQSWIGEPQLDYQRDLGKNIGRINILIGATFQETSRDNIAFRGTGFSSESLMENLGAASNVRVLGAAYSQYRYNALFGRISYNLKDKYLINLTGRRDGSSRFGPGRQFSNFGSVGLGWIFSAENFLKNYSDFISYGKLRISYGLTGSDQISDYQYLDSYSSSDIVYQGITGLVPTGLFNPNYAWETNRKAEMTIELGFFKNRIYLDFSYYHNRSSNQLVGLPLPAITGFSFVQSNFPALVQNTGIEATLNASIIKQDIFSWTTTVNLTVPRNKLLRYNNLEQSDYSNTYEVGKSLSIAKKFHFTGVDPQTGVYSFEDIDKDGQVSYPNDLQALKERSQRYYGGIGQSLKYGNWELYFFTQFVKQTGTNYLFTFTMPGRYLGNLGNQPTEVLDRWTSPGDNTTIQKFSQSSGTPAADAYNKSKNTGDNLIDDASYVRLKNLSLSYRFSSRLLRIMRLKNLQLYLQGQNLFTITGYKGYDPETQSLGTPLPPLKVFSAGVRITI